MLRDWLDERTLAKEPDLLVVDKPARLPVHGGDVTLGEDLVGRLAAWLRGLGEPTYLGVHQRLDRGASGVLLFTRSSRHNAEVARAFAEHTVERVYVAAVSGRTLPDAGELVHRLAVTKGRPTRVVEHGARLARARYRVLARRQDRGAGRGGEVGAAVHARIAKDRVTAHAEAGGKPRAVDRRLHQRTPGAVAVF
ncbi:MAG TPA: pseudouridine synthase, partial [Polyangiaceae bacterium]|nr:pseudouridine synthase [Polyangiaceae bacterium]